MALDPRTPVVVGVGQVTQRPPDDGGPALEDRLEPADLMAAALRAAAEDCTGAPKGRGGAGDRLLRRLDSLRVVNCLSWRVANPAGVVAERLDIEPDQTMLTAIGGNTPQSLLHDSARAIAAGHLDAVGVVGAECMYTRGLARRAQPPVELGWATGPVGQWPDVVAFGSDRAPATDLETRMGMALPVQVYPLFENALRIASGWSLEEHRARIGRLAQGFSEVAAANPFAYLRTARNAEEIVTPSADNRMVAFPYPKLCTANMTVDQAAGFLCCSVEAARTAGIPEDRWVFPLSGAEANDHWFVSERPELHRSPAIARAGRAALSLAGVGVDDLEAIDLYSCFPCVVQIAAAELGLDADDRARPLTLTGGLTFFGGPGNNYTSHGIAALVERLRRTPGSVGMATGLGWYATKHAIGIYGSRPPAQVPGFAWRDVQDEVDRLARVAVDEDAQGEVELETYTVVYDRDGAPERAIAVCRTRSGDRALAGVTDPDTLAELVSSEVGGRRGTLTPDGQLALR